MTAVVFWLSSSGVFRSLNRASRGTRSENNISTRTRGFGHGKPGNVTVHLCYVRVFMCEHWSTDNYIKDALKLLPHICAGNIFYNNFFVAILMWNYLFLFLWQNIFLFQFFSTFTAGSKGHSSPASLSKTSPHKNLTVISFLLFLSWLGARNISLQIFRSFNISYIENNYCGTFCVKYSHCRFDSLTLPN